MLPQLPEPWLGRTFSVQTLGQHQRIFQTSYAGIPVGNQVYQITVCCIIDTRE